MCVLNSSNQKSSIYPTIHPNIYPHIHTFTTERYYFGRHATYIYIYTKVYIYVRVNVFGHRDQKRAYKKSRKSQEREDEIEEKEEENLWRPELGA